MMRRAIAGSAVIGLAILAGAPAAVAAPKSYTAQEVAKHATASSCWTIVGTSVYEMTSYIARHPGGSASIRSLCGRDGSAMFRSQHGGQPSAKKTLARYRIGSLSAPASSPSASSPSPSASSGASSSNVITAANVAKHATPADCWTTISGRVYDLTPFIASHPGGVARIITLCGIDGTSAFIMQHAGNPYVLAALAPLIIGTAGSA